MKWNLALIIVSICTISVLLLIYMGETNSKQNTVVSSHSNYSTNTTATPQNSNLKTYYLTNSQFKLPSSWEIVGKDGSNFATFTSKDLAICNLVVWSLDGKSQFDSEKTDITQNTGYTVETSFQAFGGVSVEKYILNDLAGGPVSYVYLFEKNEKYYKVNINIREGSADFRQSFMKDNLSTIDNLISTIVNSMV